MRTAGPVDDKKIALQAGAINFSQEDYGLYILFGLPLGDTSLDTLVEEMDEEIEKLKSELISERDYQKIQNKFENDFVSSNSSVEGIANSLARYHMRCGAVRCGVVWCGTVRCGAVWYGAVLCRVGQDRAG